MSKIDDFSQKNAFIPWQMHHLMRRIRMVIEYTRYRVKKKSKLTNLKIFQELKGIMVNKGRIDRELGKFERYL